MADDIKTNGYPATLVCPNCEETILISEHLKLKGFQQIVYACTCGYHRYWHVDADGKHQERADVQYTLEESEE